MRVYNRFLKRFLDIVLSMIALLFLLPAFLLITICIKLDSKGPVLFKQKRVGKDREEFYIIKFRTMKADAPHNMPTALLTNPEQHITKLGKFLRKSSLDELPQLVNIIKGDMSIVGPRPVIKDEKALIIKREHNGVYKVKPGLTGLAQVNGRDTISIKEKVAFDSEYVSNLSFSLDVKILVKTILNVLQSNGVREGAQINSENSIEPKQRVFRQS
ncbi:sugar transferase [Fredinandcohnia sp. FSL W7-1320]|uniref:sugar transferase n=1 Tax=Fredinandcohnia sp. FSL W7-1320 TaxID=2954540 RepID=UPI0030FD2C31